MKPSFNRRLRRRSKPAKNEGAFFKKESSAEHGFFCEASHGAFFQPAVSNGQVVQRKCTCCDHSSPAEKEEQKVQRAAMDDKKDEDDKKLQRAADKKEEDDKKLMRVEEKKEEDKKLQRAPEKKEEDDKKLQRATDKKEEDDKKLMRASVSAEATADKEDDKKLQKKESGAAPATNHVGGYVSSLNGKGHSMPPLTNQFFAKRMGYDFSQVKVHTDKDAAESAKSVNAKAYAIGNNIVFNEGQYNPESIEGKKLLAHELTHVVQQGATEEGANSIESPIQRTVNYVAPTYTKEDPIPRVVANRNSLLGVTNIMVNGNILRTRNDAIATIWGAFAKGISPVFDPATKTFTVDVNKINVDVSAAITVLTDPVDGKWFNKYPVSLLTSGYKCLSRGVVDIQLLGRPFGRGDALYNSVWKKEQEHYQDILTLSKKHLEPFYNYLQSIRLPANSVGDARLELDNEIGTKDYDMVTAFVDELLAANAKHDRVGGPHSFKSITDEGDCDPVTVYVYIKY
jgi:hypothetical protein